MNQRVLLTIARYVSIIFTPFYLPLMGQIALFALSYMRMLPLTYKLTVLLLIYTCTVMAPTYLIRIYRHYQGWHIWHVFSREERMVPYVISIACYFLCFYLLNLLHVPYFMSSIVVAAIAVQILCALTNNFWKISTHTAAIGGTMGCLVAFSIIFGFNPLWWTCVLIILAGIVGTGRMLLRQHTLGEVVGGFLLGSATGFTTVLLC